MAVDQTQISADIAHIYTDLNATNATEVATIYAPNGTTERGTASVIRGIKLNWTQLKDSGFADLYKESVYIQSSENPGVVREDIITMTNGDFRVLFVAPGPMDLIVRLDLGDRWE